ncbi:hypothetical protein B0A64_13035 [Flavobacterium araucananum]|jgi:hypothetical protein|uniref:Gliding motility protein SprC n=1 Tax=Flavobacterium araucananum TaxID=946678 RepID=A0A227P8V3_9FLAO|nr:hypothetical protein B0A64_13035 [Flavobacterium araucananum]
MIQRTTLSLTKCFLFLSILFVANSKLQAQTIVPQTLDGLEKLCAGNNFNEFFATFSYIDFPAGTTFEIELSNSQGSYAVPIATTKLLATDVSATSQTIKFAVPVTITGADTYSFRVKSSLAGAQPSASFKNTLGSTSFPIYFKDYEASFVINNKSDVAMLCSGGSLTLSINNDTPTVVNSSPVNYSRIKYKWYKDDVAIAGQSSKELVVSAPGKYYAEIDYGMCSDVNFSSNRVTVSTSGSGGSAVTITSSLGNPFCASTDGTILTATQGNHYVWKKDGAAFGGDTRTVTAKDAGIYTVAVDFGGCNSTGTIDLKNNGFNASIDVADEFELTEGQTLNVTVTTDAASPTFEWYLNNNLIAGATTDTYVVAAIGVYKVKISQVSGCLSSKEFSFKAKGQMGPATVIPNVVSLANPYWNIPDAYKTAGTKIMILSSNGEIMFDDVGSNYDPEVNSFIKDFKNVNPVYYYVIQSDTGEKKGSITVIR